MKAVYQRVAWTGGDRPFDRPISIADHLAFTRIRGDMYREQLRDWFTYWGDLPDRDVRYIFWNRATHDAWRTVTDGKLSQ